MNRPITTVPIIPTASGETTTTSRKTSGVLMLVQATSYWLVNTLEKTPDVGMTMWPNLVQRPPLTSTLPSIQFENSCGSILIGLFHRVTYWRWELDTYR